MDDEIKGEGNSLNYEFRMHDPRVGRFFSVDPLAKDYPYLTPYQFSSNRPIDMLELEGLEAMDTDAVNFGYDSGDPFSPYFMVDLVTTAAYDIKHALINTALRIITSETRVRYKTNKDGKEVFVSEYYEPDDTSIVGFGKDVLGTVLDVATISGTTKIDATDIISVKTGKTQAIRAGRESLDKILNISSDQIKIVTYKFKHYINSSANWKQVVKSTKNGPSKFNRSNDNVDILIKEAWDNGTVVNNGKTWKVYKSEEVVGAVSGKETNYMRVEMTPSTKEVHASPISESQYNKLTKEVE